MESVKRSKVIFLILSLMFLMALSIRLLITFKLNQSALQYVGLPFLIGLILCWANLFFKEAEWQQRYKNMISQSMFVFLGCSIVLFEGFICILFFMPIYILFIWFAFFIEWLWRKYRTNRTNKTYASILPLIPVIIFLSSLEGTIPELSFDREISVSKTKVIKASI